MHWWHAGAVRLVGSLPLAFERSLGYYELILPKARAAAARQGIRRRALAEDRTSPTGDESPSNVGPFLVWQQPHPIFYAELAYRQRSGPRDARQVPWARSSSRRRNSWRRFLPGNTQQQRFVLGPPLQCAQETYPKDRTQQLHLRAELLPLGPADGQAWARAARPAPRARVEPRHPAGSEKPARRRRQVPVRPEPRTDTYATPEVATDHPSRCGSARGLAGIGHRPADDGADVRMDLGTLELAVNLGLDYPMMAMTAARLGVQDMLGVFDRIAHTDHPVFGKQGGLQGLIP